MWLADTRYNVRFCHHVHSGLVVLGIVSYPRLGVDLFPKVDFPIVSIYTVLPGCKSGDHGR